MVVVTVTLGAVALGENVWIWVEGLKSFIGFGKRKGGLGLKGFLACRTQSSRGRVSALAGGV